jgi:hypothetical protein
MHSAVNRISAISWPAAACVALLGLLVPAEPVRAQQPVPAAALADAYADEAARELVRQARIRRSMVDRRIAAYEARAVERATVGLRAVIGERLLYRRETVSQIYWTRDTVRIEVLGAREVLPPFSAAPQVPANLSGYMPSIAFDPVDSELLLRFDDRVLRHPLGAGSEADYRFAAGDSTVIRLPDGRTVRLRELRITPRRSDRQLISGSFWLEAETHAVVQAYFRLAAGFESRRGTSLIRGGGELDYFAIDYGFWELRWWLPRTVAAQGVLHVGPVRMPLSYERRYDGYVVTGDTTALPAPDAAAEGVPARLCRPRSTVSIQARVGAEPDTTVAAVAERMRARQDTVRPAPPDTAAAAAGAAGEDCDRVFIVSQPDVAALLASDVFVGDIYAGDMPVVESAELRAIAERMRRIADPPWRLATPVLRFGLGDGLIRYNRVEGLAPGLRAHLDFGPVAADAGLRVGTASGEIGAHLGVERRRPGWHGRLAGYRRLDAVDVAAQPFTLGSSASALLLGRDDNDYFRATGVDFTLRPPPARAQWYDLRLFAERHAAVTTATDFSVRRLVDTERGFRTNITADPADQAGATLRLRTAGVRRALRWGAELELHGEAGDHTFARPAVRLRAAAPLATRFTAGVELAGGSSFGDVSAQRLWQIGGPGTLRGFDAAAARGAAFWNGRAELGVGLPYARVVAFGDAGWAGPRDALQTARPLTSAGIGLGLLDGLVRFDLARATQTRRWKVHLQFDGIL